MFQHKTIREIALEERAKRVALELQLMQQRADTDYIAMMADIELDTAPKEEDDDEI